MRNTTIVTALVVAACGSANAMDQGGNSGVQPSNVDALAQLPQPGQQALQKEASEHEGHVTDVDRKNADGSTYFVAKLQNQDHSWRVKLSEDGKIVEIQEPQVAWEDLPRPVRDAALGQVKQGEMITKTVRSRRDGQEIYKFDLEQDGQGRDVAFDATGKQVPPTKSQGRSGSQSGSQPSK